MNRTALIVAAMMVCASAGAVLLKPEPVTLAQADGMRLEQMVPSEFAQWREAPQIGAQVVNPQAQELLDRIYSQILTRSYINAEGYVVMLSIAYGSDQRGALQAHKPEVCYPAQGFTLHDVQEGSIGSAFGVIPVTRLSTSLQSRREPVTYWFTVGDRAVQSTFDKRLVELRYLLTGQIPDGLLFRVSSIDPDPVRAYRVQQQFVNELLDAIAPEARLRLTGLDGAPSSQ